MVEFLIWVNDSRVFLDVARSFIYCIVNNEEYE
jgi:hypothetical protein